MERHEVFSTIVMEQVSEPVKPKNLKVNTINGLTYVEFDTILQVLNRQNRNRRTYTDMLKNDLTAEHIREMQSKNSWCGEAGHPIGEDINRIMNIDPTMISHHIPETSTFGDVINGKVITLDNGGFGTQMTRAILQGLEPAFSLRALTKLTKRPDGSTIAQGRSHIICYDWVILPSHKEAYRNQDKAIKIVSRDLDGASSRTVTESLIPVTESMIIDFIAMESVNVNIISNIYEVTKESMVLTPDMKNVVLKDEGRTFHVKIEDKIQSDIGSYLSKF